MIWISQSRKIEYSYCGPSKYWLVLPGTDTSPLFVTSWSTTKVLGSTFHSLSLVYAMGGKHKNPWACVNEVCATLTSCLQSCNYTWEGGIHQCALVWPIALHLNKQQETLQSTDLTSLLCLLCLCHHSLQYVIRSEATWNVIRNNQSCFRTVVLWSSYN